MQASKVLLLEQNRKAKRGMTCRDSPVVALRHYHPSFITKYYQLITTFELLEFLKTNVTPTLKPKNELTLAIINVQALLIAFMEVLETQWSVHKWIYPEKAKLIYMKKRLDKLIKNSTILTDGTTTIRKDKNDQSMPNLRHSRIKPHNPRPIYKRASRSGRN